MRHLQFPLISFLLFFRDLSCIFGSVLPPVERLELGETIPALLRVKRSRSASILPRQGASCDPGEHECSNVGCCPSNQYCDFSDGIWSCCDLGKICHISSNDPRCGKQGYILCSDRPFCCPINDVCEHDDEGNFACRNQNGNFDSPVSALSTIPTPTLNLPPTITETLTPTNTKTLPATITATLTPTKTLPTTITATLTTADTNTIRSTVTATTNTIFKSVSTSELQPFATTTSGRSTFTASTIPVFATSSDVSVSLASKNSMASSSIITASLIASLVAIFFL